MSEKAGLIPHLVVKGAAEAIEFYKAALGAVEVARMPADDGRIMHAALAVGGSTLFLCDDFPEYCGGVSRAPAGHSPVTLHLCVPSADAAIVSPCAFSVGANSGISAPVVMSKARMLARGVSLVPRAAPAGRAWENDPVA